MASSVQIAPRTTHVPGDHVKGSTREPQQRPVHPAAAVFPLIHGADFEAFVEDIERNGLNQPVTLDAEGRVLDGRNRVRACERLGIEPSTVVYDGDDPVQFVISQNLHRRQMTDSQRAMAAAELATLSRGTNRYTLDPSSGGSTPTTGQVMESMSVSQGSFDRAKRIHRDGTPALRELAKDEDMPLATLARVAVKLSPSEQDAYVAQVRAGANPRVVAPAGSEHGPRIDAPRLAVPQPPKFGGWNRRKHVAQIESLITVIEGAVTAFVGLRDLDGSVTREEASRLKADLSVQIKALADIRKLIEERTK